MATLVRGKTFGATESVTNAKLHALVDDATISDIIDTDIASDAGISSTKIDFSLKDYVTLAGDQTIGGTKTFNTSPVMPDSFWSKVYPVGIVITLGVSTNPADLFGFGTWTAIAGRVIVGIDATQTEFDTLNETGGAKTHTLTKEQTPTTSVHDINAGDVAANGSNIGCVSGITFGSGDSFNILQPYIVKYVWQRAS